LDPAQVDALVPRVTERLGGPEILVNVAGGVAGAVPGEGGGPGTVSATRTLNLVAPFRLCQTAFPHMVAAGRGAIVNVSSISGQVGIPGIPQASYRAAHAGLSRVNA